MPITGIVNHLHDARCKHALLLHAWPLQPCEGACCSWQTAHHTIRRHASRHERIMAPSTPEPQLVQQQPSILLLTGHKYKNKMQRHIKQQHQDPTVGAFIITTRHTCRSGLDPAFVKAHAHARTLHAHTRTYTRTPGTTPHTTPFRRGALPPGAKGGKSGGGHLQNCCRTWRTETLETQYVPYTHLPLQQN